MSDNNPNGEYVINSLLSQISSASLRLAEQNAVIVEQQEIINGLQQEIGQLKTEKKAKK